MRVARRLAAALLGVGLAVGTAGLALRWVDVAATPVAVVQATLPFWGALVVLATGLAAVLRFRRLALAGLIPSVVAVVLAAGSVIPAGRVDPGLDDVTVLSSNLELGQGNTEDVVAAVRERRVDVVVLVELTQEALDRALGDGLQQELPYAIDQEEGGSTGVAIFSRWPLTLLDRGEHTTGSLFQEPFALVNRPSGAFRIKAIHDRQPLTSPRGWSNDLSGIGAWQRSQSTDLPLVLAGDFNSSEAHPEFRDMKQGLVDAHRAVGAGWVRTWPQGRRVPPFVQLDHVLVRGASPVDAGVVPVADTDHAAVWARLRMG